MILAPSHFGRVGVQALAADPVMHADLGAAQPGEIRLGLVGARAVLAECDRMIDPVHVVMGVQHVPATRFVGVNGRTDRDVLADRRDRVALLTEHEGKRAAVALAHDDHDLPLAGLFLRDATVDALCNLVLRLDVAAEIRAVDFLLSGLAERAFACSALIASRILCARRRPSCTGNPDRGSVEGAVALRAVDEDRDGQEIVAERPFAVSEDRSRRDAELMRAAPAFPHRARRELAPSRQPQCGQYGSPPLSAQRMRWNVARASSSVMRATALSESVLAAADKRKCWAT